MSEPLVSIIIPTYNRVGLVGETINSVLSQDYPNLEVIAIDDGSQDGSLEFLQQYGSRIRCYSHENVGETRTVNRGFSLARGEIVSVLSSDDLLLPGVIRSSVELLMSNPDIVGTYCDWIWIDGEGKILQFATRPEHDLSLVLRLSENLPGPGAFFRQDALQKVQGRDEEFRYVADFDFWLRMALLGKVQRLPMFGSAFREHSQSTTVEVQNTARGMEMLRVIQKFYETQLLPSEALELKSQALCAAHFAAACSAGHNVRFKLRHFAQAFPHISNYRRGRACLELLQGFSWARVLKRWLIERIRHREGVGQHYRAFLRDNPSFLGVHIP